MVNPNRLEEYNARRKNDGNDMIVVLLRDLTYDDLTRRPDLCFLGGRSVGVTARDPTVELLSPGKFHATGEMALSTSS